MKTFLDKTADLIINNYSNETDKICVVFPNRRSGLYLKKSIAARLEKSIWSPQIYSLEDFIISLSGFRVIDPVYLLFELYKIHKEIEGDQSQSLADFLNWGKVLLNDFNEADKYLTKTSSLFDYLTDEKALALWNPGNPTLSEFQLRYLRFYQSLKTYYNRLTSELIHKNEVYPGLAYRKVAENIETISEKLPYKKIIFAGFNALTTAEKRIISALESTGRALILWDSDRYYMDDSGQEAGAFIRPVYEKANKETFKWIGNYFRESNKNITVIGVPLSVGQAKVAGQLLEQLSEKSEELDQTAVVLNDETVVEPLLNSIPDQIGKFNLTMGLPLKSTPLFRLFDSVFELQNNILKFSNFNSKNPRIYYRDLLQVLNHPYVLQILRENMMDGLPLKILESNKTFFDFKELIDLFFSKEDLLKKLIFPVASPWNDNPAAALESLQEILSILKNYFILSYHEDKSDRENTDLEIEYLFHFQKIFHKISHLLTIYPYVEDLKMFRSLFSQLARIALPFYGEPLHGLQIMGMLETQTLDFKNIILLGVNEDFLPSGKSNNSFIPYYIRRNFSLPVHYETNAIYAYHFYRLMQRAENIFILYNSESGELGGGEKSRFISQLQYEFPKYNPNLIVKDTILKIPLHEDKIEDKIEISKSPEIIESLQNLGEYGFSASSLNTFRICPLQFYFKYVAGIDESEEPEETIEASTLGSIVHEVLAKVYQQMKGREIIVKDIFNRKNQIPELLDEALKKHYPGGDTGYGKNLLIVKVAEFYITSLLDYEADYLRKIEQEGDKLVIKEIERSFSVDLPIENELKNFNVRLSGRIDRIDYTSGILRLIDYKTGRIDSKDLAMNSWDELLTEMRLDKCFQLLFYAFIYYRHQASDKDPVCPGIISLRSPGQGFMQLHLPDNENASVTNLDRFESVLKSMLQKIFNPEEPFRQTDNIEKCHFCAFKQICNRI